MRQSRKVVWVIINIPVTSIQNRRCRELEMKTYDSGKVDKEFLGYTIDLVAATLQCRQKVFSTLC